MTNWKPSELQEALKHIYCMSKSEFECAFGDDYQWDKLKKEFKGDVARWLCYLDSVNMRFIVEHLDGYLMQLRQEEEARDQAPRKILRSRDVRRPARRD